MIVVAYLLALAAFGRKPNGSERSLLLLSMLAAAGAALAYQPARRWLTERANRLVYGERVSPDEALRTWGMRLTRAIPMDELLLQLAETLRKSMQLRSGRDLDRRRRPLRDRRRWCPTASSAPYHRR